MTDFPGGNYGGSESTCYWWLNSHLKFEKTRIVKTDSDNGSAQNSYIGNPRAENVNIAREILLESRQSNYGSWQRLCGGIVNGSERSANSLGLHQLASGWTGLSWVFQLIYLLIGKFKYHIHLPAYTHAHKLK